VTLLDSPGKAEVIRYYAARYPTHTIFVETGTGFGEQPAALADDFNFIYSIEALKTHYAAARDRLADLLHVKIIFGDSGSLIGGVLAEADDNCIIFLDAHEIADDGHAAMEMEMAAIAASPFRHVILIDDVRLCRGRKGWLSLNEIKNWAEDNGYNFEGIDDDIARLVP